MEIKTAKRLIEIIDEYSEADISHMKDYMFDLITFTHMFRTVPAKGINILELGTGRGHSLVSFALALSEIGLGKIITIDINECNDVRKRVEEIGLKQFIVFIRGKSLSEETFNEVRGIPYDLIFHDLSHKLDITEKELDMYGKLLKVGGIMLIHDSISEVKDQNVNMKESIDRFLMFNKNFQYIIEKKSPSRLGLAVLLKVKE